MLMLYGLKFFAATVIAIASVSLSSQESNNRKELAPVFERQFGFELPYTVAEIKARRFALYDAEAEWICFTYDCAVFARIVDEDTLLEEVLPYSQESADIIEDIDNVNGPDWMELPDHESTVIYFKEDYLNHIQSDFCIWANQEKSRVYMKTSNHD